MFKVIVLMLLISPLANADILLHVGSKHLVNEYNMNESNPGIGYRDSRYLIGTYYNSYEKQSVYAGKVYRYKSIDIDYGFVTGYYENYNPIQPFVSLSYQINNIQINLVPSRIPALSFSLKIDM